MSLASFLLLQTGDKLLQQAGGRTLLEARLIVGSARRLLPALLRYAQDEEQYQAAAGGAAPSGPAAGSLALLGVGR